MDEATLRELLARIKSGDLTVDDAISRLRDFPVAETGEARIDTHRELRLGFPEVIFCDGKTDDQILSITVKMVGLRESVLATRISDSAARILTSRFENAVYNKVARTVFIEVAERKTRNVNVAIVTAGTADIPVAEEAAVTCDALGCTIERFFDVGVAGIHRLAEVSRRFNEFDVFIVAAGMEGALASVIGGLVGKPVVAVPTSVGYGASFEGMAALLAMLNSCASGVVVVNIDSGFGAAMAAIRVSNLLEKCQ